MFGLAAARRDAPLVIKKVTLGTATLLIPVADLQSNHAGPTVVVTAGMDGDEYASIEAAYALVEKYANLKFMGRLIVLPIVNMPGFQNETSYNPIDRKFPKHVVLGNAQGTLTEQLVHWLTTTYIRGASAWMDFHGGALTETVTPFLWTFDTGVSEVDAFSQVLHAQAPIPQVLYERASSGSRAKLLAAQGCAYVVTESGGAGQRQPIDSSNHTRTVETAMRTLGMLPPDSNSIYAQKNMMREVAYLHAPADGILRLQSARSHVFQGDSIGTYSEYTGQTVDALFAPKSGTILWQKHTMALRKGETIAAIGY